MTDKPSSNFSSSAMRTITMEAEAVSALTGRIGANFERACQLLLACRGRVIVTGMGKSGHIGCKIAATLASTGTPAFFVHPGEASHGDMGMITREDAIIALSNSGEVAEVVHLTAFAQAPRIAGYRLDRQSAFHISPCCRCAPEYRRRNRGLPFGPGTHVQHDHGTGDGRCSSDRSAGATRLYCRRLCLLSPRGHPGQEAAAKSPGRYANWRFGAQCRCSYPTVPGFARNQ